MAAGAVVKAQPGAQVGDPAYCFVSGAPFMIAKGSPFADVGDKRIYFCCPACSDWFTENRDLALERRGMK